MPFAVTFCVYDDGNMGLMADVWQNRPNAGIIMLMMVLV
jgi:hypothetical protein